MKINHLLIVLLLLSSCVQQIDPPKPYGPVPSKGQLQWHEMEYFSLVCYGLNTYTEEEWAYGDVDPQMFNPSDLDTDQWARVASEAGMKGLILVAKHHDGFCLWPSKYTDYSVKATPWKDGKGDVLDDLSKSCKKYGLKLGVYLSPWDRNHAEYGRPEYVHYFYRQLEELMTEYGEIFEFWIDGASGGTGYYGGANELRNIDRRTYYGYDSIFSIVQKHQPNAVIFSDVGPGVRWVGNEAGIGSETNWNTISTAGKFPGEGNQEYTKKLGTGDPDGNEWIPAEVNTTLLWPKAWYFHTGHQPRSLANLMDLYYTSIGRGSSLDLGLAIAPTGQIRDVDAQALLKFREQVNREFAVNLAENATLTASDHRGGQAEFAADRCVDESTESYWATNDSIQQATLTIDFGQETTLNRLLLQEYIRLGQRVCAFTVEYEDNGNYKPLTQGTTIGYKRILRFDDVTTSRLRLTLETEAPCLTLSNLGIYCAPRLVADPVARFDIQGNLSFEAVEGISVFYALGEEPQSTDFQKYEGPVKLPLGGKVHAYAQDEATGFKTDLMITEFGVPKAQWNVVSVDGRKEASSAKAIDNDSKTFWLAESKHAHPHGIVLDLGTNLTLDGFSYLPRQDGEKAGIIYEYACYVSTDGKSWGEPKAIGTFSNIENNPIRRRIKFKHAIEGRFVKLVSRSDVRQTGLASFAEVEVFVIGTKS
ncbi:alpha-L-fucosidase [Sunxiuqinia sp. sy24]|uniref:alpha-L-fucosidase n=1 Tax=Sunxiuqinia sp. sy24 TaxID=3461495 RepID=UPI004046487E